MKRRVSFGVAALLLLSPAAASAANLPGIRTSDANPVPECVTPGRLTAFLRARNGRLDPSFERIAIEYMRRGEELGLRWDYTFYQMILETGSLTFRGNGGRRGDVSPSQNNFAGLGATGNGNPGESFPDVPTGVLAHLQHVLLYAGETVENPVAERTRKVQEWGILKPLQKKARGSVTFNHLATKWAPGSSYVSGLAGIAEAFHDRFCEAPDPHPEMVAEARGFAAKGPAVAAAVERPERVSGAELARRAIEDGKAEGDERRKGLGASSLAKAATPSYSLLNPSPAETPAAPPAQEAPQKPRAEKPPFVTASAAGALTRSQPARPAPGASSSAPGKCRVWTASYGGLKALIIRVRNEKGTDYTVLDVNEGAERREAEAYISAYAKGGEIAGEYASQTQALDKAFELCPES
jgi:hypothetical protein